MSPTLACPPDAARAGTRRFRLLVATTDAEVLRGVKTLLEEPYCEVLAAGSGVDCLRLLRAERPDVLVLIPPLLWGSEEGVLEVLRSDPVLLGVTALVVAGAGDDCLPPVAFHLHPDPDRRHQAPLDRLTGRLCQWWRGRPW